MQRNSCPWAIRTAHLLIGNMMNSIYSHIIMEILIDVTHVTVDD